MKEDRVDGGTTMTGIRLRQESTLKDDEIEWEKKNSDALLGMPFREVFKGGQGGPSTPDGVLVSKYFWKQRTRRVEGP